MLPGRPAWRKNIDKVWPAAIASGHRSRIDPPSQRPPSWPHKNWKGPRTDQASCRVPPAAILWDLATSSARRDAGRPFSVCRAVGPGPRRCREQQQGVASWANHPIANDVTCHASVKGKRRRRCLLRLCLGDAGGRLGCRRPSRRSCIKHGLTLDLLPYPGHQVTVSRRLAVVQHFHAQLRHIRFDPSKHEGYGSSFSPAARTPTTPRSTAPASLPPTFGSCFLPVNIPDALSL